MKKQAAAILIMAGLLCGCGIKPSTDNGSAEQVGSAYTQDKIHMLSEYVSEGTVIEDTVSEKNLVPLLINGKYAMADSVSGEPVTDAVYDAVGCLKSDNTVYLALYREGRVTCIDRNGRVIVSKKGSARICGNHIVISMDGKNARTKIYNADGELIAKAKGNFDSLSGSVLVTKTGKHSWNITDIENGNSTEINDVKSVGEFFKGYSAVHVSKNNWAVMDKNGGKTSLAGIVKLNKFCKGYALAKNYAGMYGVINSKGEEVIPFEYTDGRCLSLETPIFQLWSDDGRCVVRNAATKQKINLPSKFKGEKLSAWQSHYFSYVNQNGDTVLFDDLVKHTFDGEVELYTVNDTTMAVQSKTGCSAINLETGDVSKELAVEYIQSENLDTANDGYFAVNDIKSHKQGICSTDGKLVLDTQYDYIRPVGEGLFAAQQNGTCGIIDAKGNWKCVIKNKQ